ncbi:hypothetical protein [Bauldia litoralis]|uniref:Uncharacterized protein n=1 Tax=Bauldia litoralis TaxID=665467 RepID=A0A1G6CCV9_9HYPH|nr:hypothetical protein [Bauldia litoralis]SDB30631.1 hypothetical protein SAMN02982931_02325 [Bauldia litoralis]
MATLALLVALVALAAALIAIRMAMNAGGQHRAPGPAPAPPAPPAPPPPPAAVNYTITGTIRVTNDCDGLQASIPGRVTIKTELSNAAGTIAVPGSTTVNLAPDPASPAAPVKIGTYTITVRWLGGVPAHWTRPDVEDPATGNPVCNGIPGCVPPQVCRDRATATRTVPFVNPNTTHDIPVGCACGNP